MKYFLIIFSVMVMLLLAVVPRIISYQGKLLDEFNVAVNDTLTLTFRLYTTETGGEPLYEQTIPDVEIIRGLFSVRLSGFPDSVDFARQYWLEIAIDGERLSPRRPLTAVPYSLRAGSVDTISVTSAQIVNGSILREDLSLELAADLDTACYALNAGDSYWELSGSNLYSIPEGNVGIGTTEPAYKLDVAGDISLSTSSGNLYFGHPNIRIFRSGNNIFMDNLNAVYVRHAIKPWGTASLGEDGIRWQNYYGVNAYLSGNVGIGTVSPDARLHIVGDIKIDDGSQGEGKVLTSDATGVARWQDPPLPANCARIIALTGTTDEDGILSLTLPEPAVLAMVMPTTPDRLSLFQSLSGTDLTVKIVKSQYEKTSGVGAPTDLPSGVSLANSPYTISGSTGGPSSTFPNPVPGGGGTWVASADHTHSFSVTMNRLFSHSHTVTYTLTSLPPASNEEISVVVVYR